jgi:DNA-binding IclR family transcriptional regulator
MNERYHVPSLTRALKVVELLAGCGRKGATLAELTEQLGYPKNSIFRINATLVDMGYLSRDPESMKFRLTKKFLSYGLFSVTDANIVEQSIDLMRELRDTTDISVFLGVMYNTHGIILEQAPGGHPFKLSVDPGTHFRLFCSAPGKAMLAFLPKEQQAEQLKKIKFEKFTPQTIPDLKALRAELATVRANGYAVDHAEEFTAIHCVGAPIFDYTNHPVASLWVSGASVVLPAEKFDAIGTTVRSFAQRISERLGFFPD